MNTGDQDVVVSVSEFVALLNGALEYAFPSIVVMGELANFRVSKNRWVYFDLKDDISSVKCFGTVYQLSGPLEDGMLLRVRAQPRVHQLYGFSLNIINLQLSGEGTIKRSAALLAAKLEAEGLFDPQRKRRLPYPPQSIGLIASRESAAYVDFLKVLAARWQGVDITVADVQVQGEVAPEQIVRAIEQCNGLAEPPEVLVLTRGGGSADDLMAFNDERVVRAVAASRIPTLVAIGHEIDSSLAELAADTRASTPSNAAELLVPDRAEVYRWLQGAKTNMQGRMAMHLRTAKLNLETAVAELARGVGQQLQFAGQHLEANRRLLIALSPEAVLRRGYTIIRRQSTGLIRRAVDLQDDDMIELQFYDGTVDATVRSKGKYGKRKT